MTDIIPRKVWERERITEKIIEPLITSITQPIFLRMDISFISGRLREEGGEPVQ